MAKRFATLTDYVANLRHETRTALVDADAGVDSDRLADLRRIARRLDLDLRGINTHRIDKFVEVWDVARHPGGPAMTVRPVMGEPVTATVAKADYIRRLVVRYIGA